MQSRDEAPAELAVQTDLDGFRCTLLPYKPSENWVLLWVPLWWAMSAGCWVLALWLDPSLADVQLDTAPAWTFIAVPAGLMGWAPSFMWWRARRSRVPVSMNLDPGRLTVGERSWAIGDIVSAEEARFGVRLTLRRGTARVLMRSNGYAARKWVAAQIQAALPTEAPAPPEALQAMRGVDD